MNKCWLHGRHVQGEGVVGQGGADIEPQIPTRRQWHFTGRQECAPDIASSDGAHQVLQVGYNAGECRINLCQQNPAQKQMAPVKSAVTITLLAGGDGHTRKVTTQLTLNRRPESHKLQWKKHHCTDVHRCSEAE